MEEQQAEQAAWRPLKENQRRVVGVLVEKAKTTPDAYPMTLNGLTTGCNQKSNRDPQMKLETFEVEDALEQLREMGAVAEVHGDGRVVKFRHYMKDWLGCEGDELAVMAELLLRGPQTVGELRGRAARMGKIPDLTSLQPILDGLREKGLVIPLSPAGRGQVVTHGLYPADEMDRVRKSVVGGGSAAPAPSHAPQSPVAPPSTPTTVSTNATPQPVSHTPSASAVDQSLVEEMRSEIASLKGEMERMKKEIEDLWSNLG
ncbi:MAG: DUF480 domain-containing protein [Pirellulaceae bacterium]